jgi:hypothetical protein
LEAYKIVIASHSHLIQSRADFRESVLEEVVDGVKCEASILERVIAANFGSVL